VKKDSIGNRLKKNYEFRQRDRLLKRIPVIIRLDGRTFHTITKYCKRPFDKNLINVIGSTAVYLCDNIQGAKCAYCQSDEISILVTDFDRLTTDAWFDYVKSKVESISAGLASAYFTVNWSVGDDKKIVVFDSRARNYPKEEVCNYFIWRQQDWTRNSITMYTRSVYSHDDLLHKKQPDMHDMLHEKGLNWADLEDVYKNGIFIYKNQGSWTKRHDIIFTKDRDKIDNLLIPEED